MFVAPNRTLATLPKYSGLKRGHQQLLDDISSQNPSERPFWKVPRRDRVKRRRPPRFRFSIKRSTLITAVGIGVLGTLCPAMASGYDTVYARDKGVEGFLIGAVQSLLEKSHRAILDMAAKVPNLVPRMDAQECLKRTICEAHNKPGRYGLMGVGLQLFFPYVYDISPYLISV